MVAVGEWKLRGGWFWQGAGSGNARILGDVCRFADLQQLHEFTQVIRGEFTRVLRAVDEGFTHLPNLPPCARCEVDPHAR